VNQFYSDARVKDFITSTFNFTISEVGEKSYSIKNVEVMG